MLKIRTWQWMFKIGKVRGKVYFMNRWWNMGMTLFLSNRREKHYNLTRFIPHFIKKKLTERAHRKER